jgi:hypothetical protein
MARVSAICASSSPTRPGPGFGADQPADRFDHAEDVVDAAHVEGVDRHAGLDQVARDVALQVREGEHQIGPGGENLVDVAAGEGEDLGLLLARFGRAHGVAGNADDAVLFAERVEHFDGFGGQADDTLGQAGMVYGQVGGCVRHRDGRKVSRRRRGCAACGAA